MTPRRDQRSLRNFLLVADYSGKFRTHLELGATVLIISIVTAYAAQCLMSSMRWARIGELYTAPSVMKAEIVAHHYETGKWPAPRVLSDDPYDDFTLELYPEGVIRAKPNAEWRRASGFEDLSFWLSPVSAAPDTATPIIWLCTKGESPPTAAELQRRRASASHLPPTFCL
ncbi:MAG: hypothetical protein AAFX85_01700 [Pseudomonadota bacterium]